MLDLFEIPKICLKCHWLNDCVPEQHFSALHPVKLIEGVYIESLIVVYPFMVIYVAINGNWPNRIDPVTPAFLGIS